MNAHAGQKSAHLEASNAVALLRRMRGPEEVLDLLSTMAGGSATHDTRSRRAAFARRWLQRIRTDAARRWWANRAGLTGAALRAYDVAPVSFGLQALTAAAPLRVNFSDHEISGCETHENRAVSHAVFRPSQFAHWGNCPAAVPHPGKPFTPGC